jgi:hypothetical protein
VSLLDDALKLPRAGKRSSDTDDEIRLAVAWVTGVVSDSQAAGAFKVSVNNVAGRLARILKRAIESGRIRAPEVPR